MGEPNESLLEITNCAQAVLTALNVGDVQSGSPLHLRLREVMIEHCDKVRELAAEMLKGVCVYCGEVENYESLEQKAGEVGNQMRIAHIRQCEARPELKLIAEVERLQSLLSELREIRECDKCDLCEDHHE